MCPRPLHQLIPAPRAGSVPSQQRGFAGVPLLGRGGLRRGRDCLLVPEALQARGRGRWAGEQSPVWPPRVQGHLVGPCSWSLGVLSTSDGDRQTWGFVWVISAPLWGELTKNPHPTHSGLCKPAWLCHFCMSALRKPICKPIWWQQGRPGGVVWEACDVALSPQT